MARLISPRLVAISPFPKVGGSRKHVVHIPMTIHPSGICICILIFYIHSKNMYLDNSALLQKGNLIDALGGSAADGTPL